MLLLAFVPSRDVIEEAPINQSLSRIFVSTTASSSSQEIPDALLQARNIIVESWPQIWPSFHSLCTNFQIPTVTGGCEQLGFDSGWSWLNCGVNRCRVVPCEDGRAALGFWDHVQQEGLASSLQDGSLNPLTSFDCAGMKLNNHIVRH